MARRIAIKDIREIRPTIIGAGITEQWYFTHLQSLFRLKIKIRPRFFGQEDIHSLEKRIQQVLDDNGKAVVVFDADVSTWDDKEKQRLTTLKKKYANNHDVVLCDSLPSIEYWFLLHYINTTRQFGTSKAVISQLVKFLPEFNKSEGFLKNTKWISDLCSNGKLKEAYTRAKTNGTDHESYSNLWKSIDSIGLDNKVLDRD